jgi:membrane protease YdiL (CAAX protease family)
MLARIRHASALGALIYLITKRPTKAIQPYTVLHAIGGGFLLAGYLIGVAWMLVISFKPRARLTPPAASLLKPGCAVPPLLSECQTAPPVLPGFIAREPASAGGSTAPVPISTSDGAAAAPGVWFSLGWLALFFAGQVAWTFLPGWFALFRGGAAPLMAIGAASLPLVVAALAGFPRQPWGAPFAWPKPLPPVKLLALLLLGLISIPLFEAGYSKLVEWITHEPFPAQAALPFIREALQTNPVGVVLSIVFIAPMAEEVLFRGLLFGTAQRWLSAHWTILLTAALFALIHLQAIYFLPIFLVGLLCGWARHKSGSVAVPMVIHVLNNGFSLAVMQLFPNAT